MITNTSLNCIADESNSFYGNQGALKCLREAGDVAILELQYLKGTPNTKVKRIELIIYLLQLIIVFILNSLDFIIIGIACNQRRTCQFAWH